MWYFIFAIVINGVATVEMMPVKDLEDCKQKAGMFVEMIKKDPVINQPTNTIIYSCKQVKIT